MTTSQREVKSPLGKIFIVASKGFIAGLYWENPQEKTDTPGSENSPVLEEAVKQIHEYFKGKRQIFNLPLNLQGTSFQKKVWAALQTIPFGETISYKDLAKKIKNPKASRAVGSANGKNPICIIIPCHRVINENGKIGGYTGGLYLKTGLLSLEKKTEK